MAEQTGFSLTLSNPEDRFSRVEAQIFSLHFSVEAQKLEKISLQHLQDLIHRIEEVVGLLKITVEHQFHMLTATLTQVHKVFKAHVLYKDCFFHTTALGGASVSH